MFAVSSSLTMTDTTISNNIVSSSYANGGGAYLSSCNTTIMRCLFSNNSASYSGGGLYTTGGSTTVNHTDLNSNYAARGGGVYSSGTILIFSSSGMLLNAASYGGGVFLSGSSLSEFVDCMWSKNAVTQTGGGAYVTGSATVVYFQAYVFHDNTATQDSYRDLYAALGSIYLSNGCTDGLHNFGTGLLRCYGCSITYPADLNRTRCKPWTSSVDVHSGRELAAAVMLNSTINLMNDVTVRSEVAVVGFNSLTGAVFDGGGIYTIFSSQEQQRRRSLLALAPTRYQLQ